MIELVTETGMGTGTFGMMSERIGVALLRFKKEDCKWKEGRCDVYNYVEPVGVNDAGTNQIRESA